MSPAPLLDQDLVERLAVRFGRETMVVGIGNPWRGDDGAGCLVARFLGSPDGPGSGSAPGGARVPGLGDPKLHLRVIDAEEVPESFLGSILDPPPNTVILVDAVEMNAPPGSVALLDLDQVEDRGASTHRAPLSLLARFIEAESGADVFLLGIQPDSRILGTQPCTEVQKAAVALAGVLREAARLAAALREATAPW